MCDPILLVGPCLYERQDITWEGEILVLTQLPYFILLFPLGYEVCT